MASADDNRGINDDKFLMGNGFSVIDSDSLKMECPGDDVAADAGPPVEQTEAVVNIGHDEKVPVKSEEVKQSVGDNQKMKETSAGSVKEVIESKDESLIISTEDDLVNVLEEKSENISSRNGKSPKAVRADKKNVSQVEKVKPNLKSVQVPKKNVVKRHDSRVFWVSNITRHIKASDLKKYVGQHGNVSTVKILSNGKSLYGYVLMETFEFAEKCIKLLNHTIFDGRKIYVSAERPDSRKKRLVEGAQVKITKKPEKVESNSRSKEESSTKKLSVQDMGMLSKEDESKKKSEADWKKELHSSKLEVTRLNRRLSDTQRKLTNEYTKLRSCEREIQNLNFQLRTERRKFNRQLEEAEKKNKFEQVRMEADRAVLNKDMAEVRRLRDHLKTKIEELKDSVLDRSMAKMKDSRGSSPSQGSSFRQTCDNKKRKWLTERNRTPPPPPKLSVVNDSRKRTSENRHFYEDKKSRRSSPTHFDYENRSRRRPSFNETSTKTASTSAVPTRASWAVPYLQQGQWRMSAPDTSQQFTNARYCSYPMQQASFPSSSRDHHFFPSQEYSKHGHYDQNRKH